LMLDGLKQILRVREFWYLAIVLFIGNGIFNGLSTWVETIVRPRGLSISDAGDLAGAMLLGGIIGSIAMPALSDRLRKRKGLMVVGFAIAIPGMIGAAFGVSYILLLASFFWLGLFTTGIAPVAYQYGAEVTYPVPEGTSNGLFALAGQISVVFIFVMGWSNDALGSYVPSLIVLIVLMLIGVVLLALLKESPMMKAPVTSPPIPKEIIP
jgi:MFS family permease